MYLTTYQAWAPHSDPTSSICLSSRGNKGREYVQSSFFYPCGDLLSTAGTIRACPTQVPHWWRQLGSDATWPKVGCSKYASMACREVTIASRERWGKRKACRSCQSWRMNMHVCVEKIAASTLLFNVENSGHYFSHAVLGLPLPLRHGSPSL